MLRFIRLIYHSVPIRPPSRTVHTLGPLTPLQPLPPSGSSTSPSGPSLSPQDARRGLELPSTLLTSPVTTTSVAETPSLPLELQVSQSSEGRRGVWETGNLGSSYVPGIRGTYTVETSPTADEIRNGGRVTTDCTITVLLRDGAHPRRSEGDTRTGPGAGVLRGSPPQRQARRPSRPGPDIRRTPPVTSVDPDPLSS